jgi:hypothetical protein
MCTVNHFIALRDKHVLLQEDIQRLLPIRQIKNDYLAVIRQVHLEAGEHIEASADISCQIITEEEAGEIDESSRRYALGFIADEYRHVRRVEEYDEYPPLDGVISLYWRDNAQVVRTRQLPVDDDEFQTVAIALLSGADPVGYTALRISSWHSAYSEFLGALGILMRDVNTSPWDVLACELVDGHRLDNMLVRLFIYPCLEEEDAACGMGRLLTIVHTMYGLCYVLHELRWDDWFAGWQTHGVMPPQGYGLLVVPDDHVAPQARVRPPDATLDRIVEDIQAIDDARGLLGDWLARHEGFVIRRRIPQ